MQKKQKLIKGKRSMERLSHFFCGACDKWWGIGDAPAEKIIWHCPWCGKKQILE